MGFSSIKTSFPAPLIASAVYTELWRMSKTLLSVGFPYDFTKRCADNSESDGLGKINLLPCSPSTEGNYHRGKAVWPSVIFVIKNSFPRRLSHPPFMRNYGAFQE
jgi:hypothetical protein